MNITSTSCFCAAALTAMVVTLARCASAAEAESLKEVVVSAQFKPENAQDVPISISIISAEQLEQLQIWSLVDIDKAAPNVVLRESQNTGRAMQAFIRYVGQFDYSFTVEPGVGIYVDDQYLATLYGSLLELLDLEMSRSIAVRRERCLAGTRSVARSASQRTNPREMVTAAWKSPRGA